MLMSPDRPVVFFHIPKTAGSTTSVVFEKLFAGQPQYLAGRNGLSHFDDCVRFLELSGQTRRVFAYITGHLEMQIVAAVPGEPFVFTFLRDPLSRLVSLYQYVKRTPTHHMHQWIEQRQASVLDFIRECPWDEVYNGMTRRLAGIHSARMNDKRTLALALNNVDAHFSFVGIQEYFDECLFYLGHLLNIGMEDLVYQKKNANPNPHVPVAIDQTTKDMAERINAMDFELYEFYLKKLKEKLSRSFPEPYFKEFEAFKKAVQLQALATADNG